MQKLGVAHAKPVMYLTHRSYHFGLCGPDLSNMSTVQDIKEALSPKEIMFTILLHNFDHHGISSKDCCPHYRRYVFYSKNHSLSSANTMQQIAALASSSPPNSLQKAHTMSSLVPAQQKKATTPSQTYNRAACPARQRCSSSTSPMTTPSIKLPRPSRKTTAN